MEVSIILAKQIITMFCMAMAGVTLCKVKIINKEQSRSISSILIYVLSPCLLVNSFQTEFTPDKAAGMLASLAAGAVTLLIFTVMTETMKKGPKGLSDGERLCAIFSNAGNLIVPIVQGMFGTEYVIYTCPYVLLQSTLMWTYGMHLVGGSKGSVWKLLLKPNFLAILLGLLMFATGLRFPGPVAKAVSNLGNCTGPMSMLVIGILLASTDLKAVLRSVRTYRTLVLRLIILPLVAMAVALLAAGVWHGADYEKIYLILLLGSMGPSASTITSMAQVYRHPDAGIISSINAVTMLFCAVTMPLQCFIFENLIVLI